LDASRYERRATLPTRRDVGPADVTALAVHLMARLRDGLGAVESAPCVASARSGAKAGMSERTFVRQFRLQTGTTPHRWLTHQRVLAAQRRFERTARLDRSDRGVDGFGDGRYASPAFPPSARYHAYGISSSIHDADRIEW